MPFYNIHQTQEIVQQEKNVMVQLGELGNNAQSVVIDVSQYPNITADDIYIKPSFTYSFNPDSDNPFQVDASYSISDGKLTVKVVPTISDSGFGHYAMPIYGFVSVIE